METKNWQEIVPCKKFASWEIRWVSWKIHACCVMLTCCCDICCLKGRCLSDCMERSHLMYVDVSLGDAATAAAAGAAATATSVIGSTHPHNGF